MFLPVNFTDITKRLPASADFLITQHEIAALILFYSLRTVRAAFSIGLHPLVISRVRLAFDLPLVDYFAAARTMRLSIAFEAEDCPA